MPETPNLTNTSNKTKVWMFSLLAIGLGLLMALIAGELLLRLTGFGYPSPLTGPKQLYIKHPDPELGFTMRPNYSDNVFGCYVEINSNGLRDYEYNYKKPEGTKRILILGDSVAFGYGTTKENTFAKQWEAWLNRQSEGNSNVGDWQIINSGVPGWCAIQQIRWYELEGHKYNPDAIVIAYVMNDPEPVHHLNERGQLAPQEIDLFYRDLAQKLPKPILPFTEYSNLAKFLNWMILHTHPNWKIIHDELIRYFNHEIFNLPSWPKALESYKRLHQRCEEENIPLLIAVYPTMYRLMSKEEHPFTPHYEKVKATLSEMNIPVIVALEDYIGESTHMMRAYEDDPHPGYASHRIFAQRLHRESQTRWGFYDVDCEWK